MNDTPYVSRCCRAKIRTEKRPHITPDTYVTWSECTSCDRVCDVTFPEPEPEPEKDK
ncbi:MAG: hypothetical protein PW734_06810 [Verrucomicrobium sp.]|nr:hypothetical protein [Verrucomicrobium sp.]